MTKEEKENGGMIELVKRISELFENYDVTEEEASTIVLAVKDSFDIGDDFVDIRRG